MPDERRFASTRVGLRREGLARRVRLASVIGIAAGLPIIVALAQLLGGRGVGALALPLLTVPWLTLLGSGLIGMTSHGARTLVVGEDAITIESENGFERRVPLADIRSTIAVPLATGGVRVDLVLSNGNVVEAEMPSHEEANALFDAARIDPSRRTAVMRLGRTFRRFMIGLGTFLATTMVMTFSARNNTAAIPAFFMVYALPLLIYMAARRFGSSEITVGVDGISVVYGLRRRHHSFEGLERVRVDDRGRQIELHYRDGRVVRVFAFDDDALRRNAAVVRIGEALQAYRNARTERGVAELLARNGRPLDDWRKELARLVAPDAEYRSTHVGEENARRVMRDASASVEHRIGAAVALVAVRGDEARREIRVAAEACVEPRLRLALERAAQGEIDEAALEEEAVRVRRV